MPFRRIPFTAALLLHFLLSLSVLLPTGCAPKLPPKLPPKISPKPTPEPVKEKDAGTLINQAESLFFQKQYDQSLSTLEVFFARFPASNLRDRALYLQGEVRLIRREYPQALSYYKEIIERFPASSLILQSRYKLGLCYFEIKEYDSAIANLWDRSRIVDPAQLKRISEMLSFAYAEKMNYVPAVRELALLAEAASTEQQKAGYQDRIRELIDKKLTEEDLSSFASGTRYPSDIAQLRLAGLLIEQRKYREAAATSKTFLDTFPSHPERTRGEMLQNEALAGLAAPSYYIGALLPQSGQLAFFGDRVLKGIQLAVHTYNLRNPGSRVELLVKDTEGSPDKTIAALTELSSKGIVAAIGPLLTKEAEALVPSLTTLGIPVITPAASGEGLGKMSPWLFRNALTNSSQASVASQFALSLNLKKLVILYPDDAYGKDLARLFTRELERKIEILATIAYPTEVKDFGPYVRKIIEIDLRSQKIPIPDDDVERKKLFDDYKPSFDALYLPGHADKIGLLIPQLAFYNITGMTMIGSNNWHTPDLIERADRHAEGAVFIDGFFPESSDPAIKPVIESYRSAYQEEPDILAAQGYDAAMMVLSLLEARKDTPLAIRDGLLALKDYPGISGTITFPGIGEAQKKLFIIKVQDGKFVEYSNGK